MLNASDTIPTPPVQIHGINEEAYKNYVAEGVSGMFRNKEFCNLTISDFFEYLCESNGGQNLMITVIKHLMTMPIDPNDHYAKVHNQQKIWLCGYLKRFVNENDERFFTEFLEQNQISMPHQSKIGEI